MAITTTSIVSPQVELMASWNLLAVPYPLLIHGLGAMDKEMGSNAGRSIRFRRYSRLPLATIPLGNSGQDPAPTPLDAVDIDATMGFYAAYVELNEQTVLQNQEDMINATTILLGLQMRETEDALVRNMLQSTSSVINARFGTNGDNPTNLGMGDFSAVGASLADNNALTVLNSIYGENRFGTAPVSNCFYALGSTKLIPSMNNLVADGFIRKINYPSQETVMESEYGSAFNVRVFLSSNGAVIPNASARNRPIYQLLTGGMEAYAMVKQNNYSTQFFYRPAQLVSAVLQNCQLGWKMATVPRLCNDLWLYSVNCTA